VYALASVGTRLHIGGDFQRSSSGLESPYWITLNDGVLAVDPDPKPPAMTPGASVPNPTHGVSRVHFTLERAAPARVTILDVAGRQVRRLTDATFQPGTHDVTWDGADDAGRSCPAGLYFYRVALGDHAFTRRVVLAR
jgi:hypothetical protein